MRVTKGECDSRAVEQYIRNEPATVQKALKALRSLIGKQAPEATEKLAWGMPTYYLNGNLIHFAAFKDHIGVFPGKDAVASFRREIRRMGLICSTIKVQIPNNSPLPTKLLVQLVKYCVKRNTIYKVDTKLQRPKRARNAMPAFVRAALSKSGLAQAFSARPPYQRNDYLGWIGQAVREETRKKRLAQMLRELKGGDKYMNMPYRAKAK